MCYVVLTSGWVSTNPIAICVTINLSAKSKNLFHLSDFRFSTVVLKRTDCTLQVQFFKLKSVRFLFAELEKRLLEVAGLLFALLPPAHLQVSPPLKQL